MTPRTLPYTGNSRDPPPQRRDTENRAGQYPGALLLRQPKLKLVRFARLLRRDRLGLGYRVNADTHSTGLASTPRSPSTSPKLKLVGCAPPPKRASRARVKTDTENLVGPVLCGLGFDPNPALSSYVIRARIHSICARLRTRASRTPRAPAGNTGLRVSPIIRIVNNT